MDNSCKSITHRRKILLLNKIYSDKATLADQEEMLKDSWLAYKFAQHINGANIKKCQKALGNDSRLMYYFTRDVPGANVEMSLNVCKGTRYEIVLNKLLMEKALL